MTTTDYRTLLSGGREILSCVDETGKPFAAAVGDEETPVAIRSIPAWAGETQCLTGMPG